MPLQEAILPVLFVSLDYVIFIFVYLEGGFGMKKLGIIIGLLSLSIGILSIGVNMVESGSMEIAVSLFLVSLIIAIVALLYWIKIKVGTIKETIYDIGGSGLWHFRQIIQESSCNNFVSNPDKKKTKKNLFKELDDAVKEAQAIRNSFKSMMEELEKKRKKQ